MGNILRMKYATTQQFGIGGIAGGVAYTYIRVKVRNLAYEKDVRVHFRDASAPGAWPDRALSWLGNYGSYDVFGTSNDFVSDEFVLRARVGTETEWDNNDGLNYHLTTFQNLAGGNVVLNHAMARQGTQAGGGFVFQTSWFEGQIYVNNLCFAKRVGVRFSEDGGTTWQDADGSYVGPVTEGTYATSTGAEAWYFRTPEYNYNPASGEFLFAVYFQRLDTNQVFWDNNFYLDYRLSKVPGAKIE